MENLVIFESNINNGPISLKRDYYGMNLKYDEIEADLKLRLDKLGEEKGFCSDKLIKVIQKNKSNDIDYPDGKYLLVNDNLLKKEKLWNKSFYDDMIVLTDKNKNVPIGSAVADCPVLIIEDKFNKVAILAHCGAECIDRYLPILMIENLKNLTGCRSKEIKVYISSCISYSSYEYDNYPKWATNKDVWRNSITLFDKKYYINLRKAIKAQLLASGIKHENITINYKDTYTSDELYSNSAYKKGNVKKLGRYLVGCYYK